ncbi:MAG: thioesterase family protein [Lacibacter sp.]
MSRIKIDLPDSFSFTAIIPIRITDINYGNHVGNDAVLSIIHEARMQFLSKLGYTELNLEGVGLIMTDVGIEFKKEMFYGDTIEVKIASADFTSVGFDLYYLLEKQKDNIKVIVAIAKTGMVCYDYTRKKIAAVPATVKEKLEAK